MGKYLVKHPVKIDGEKLFPSEDQVIEVEDRLANQHVKTGSLEKFSGAPRQTENKPSLKEVVAAISKLSPDNDDHWTTSGKPQTGALSEVVGKAVNADLRDKAFAAWKEKQEASNAEVEVAES